MNLLAFLLEPTWQLALRTSAATVGAVAFYQAPAAVLDAWRAAPGAVLVTDLSGLSMLALDRLDAHPRPMALCLLRSEMELEAALAAGASDCELAPDEARLTIRLKALQARIRQSVDLRADASVLEMMTTSPETGWRFWEYDLGRRQFTRALPANSSSRYLSLEALERMSWQSLYPEASREIIRNAIREAIEEHRATGAIRPRNVEVEIINADGSIGFRRTRLSLGLDADGQATFVRGVTWDVTDFVAARESLSSIEASLTGLQVDYRRLFDSVHDAIVIVDPVAGVILDANVRACELYDRTRSDLVGSTLSVISPQPEREREELLRALEGGASLRFDTVPLRKDGSEMALDVNASRIDYGGKPAVMSIGRDVTERHAHERELRKRDKALADASRLEAVGRLAGGIAHDFNNLLMVIESCADVIATRHS
ncbi:MAG: PAS domain S-box protein, partial [Myxococcales bacterium]|nr:PAS domain S-box protein [Myxococcales bacterium]